MRICLLLYWKTKRFKIQFYPEASGPNFKFLNLDEILHKNLIAILLSLRGTKQPHYYKQSFDMRCEIASFLAKTKKSQTPLIGIWDLKY